MARRSARWWVWLGVASCAEPPPAAPARDAGATEAGAPVEDPCAQGLLRELSADAARDGDVWTLTHDATGRAVQGALLAPCATAEHVTVWRHELTRDARVEVTVESADPLETVAWVLDRCAPVLAASLACAPSAPAEGGARVARGLTAAIQRAGSSVYVAVGGARRPPRAGEGPRATAGRFTLRVRERPPLATGERCAAAGSLAECARDASCQPPEVASPPVCIADGARNGRCRATGAPCGDGLRCVDGVCRGPVPEGAPCPLADPFACPEESSCVVLGAEPAYCRVDGSEEGSCRRSGAPCDEGLVCSGTPGNSDAVCFTPVADGGPCFGDFRLVCRAGSTCVLDIDSPEDFQAVCARDGGRGGACRDADPACDAGFACNVQGGGAVSLCLPALRVGDACVQSVLPPGACPPPASCVAEATGAFCREPPYRAPTLVPGRSLDACDGGTTLALPGDADHPPAPVELPFSATFFGERFDRVWPSLRGYAVLGGQLPSDSRAGRFPIVGEGPSMAPLAADLARTPATRLCARVDRAPSRLVLSWHGLALRARDGSNVDVSASITEAGEVEFQYVAVAPGTDPAAPSARAPMGAGIQGRSGALFLRAAVPAAGTGLRFTPR